jgi:hypothetical protein
MPAPGNLASAAGPPNACSRDTLAVLGAPAGPTVPGVLIGAAARVSVPGEVSRQTLKWAPSSPRGPGSSRHGDVVSLPFPPHLDTLPFFPQCSPTRRRFPPMFRARPTPGTLPDKKVTKDLRRGGCSSGTRVASVFPSSPGLMQIDPMREPRNSRQAAWLLPPTPRRRPWTRPARTSPAATSSRRPSLPAPSSPASSSCCASTRGW